MVAVGFEVRTIDQDIVEVNYDAVVEERAEDIVDKMLEGGRSVAEAKRYYSEFIVTVACTKSCLWYVIVLNTDLVVVRAEVEFGEYLGTLNPVEDLIDAGEGILIFDH